MNHSDLDKPATKRDLYEPIQSGFFWQVIVQIIFIGAIAGHPVGGNHLEAAALETCRSDRR